MNLISFSTSELQLICKYLIKIETKPCIRGSNLRYILSYCVKLMNILCYDPNLSNALSLILTMYVQALVHSSFISRVSYTPHLCHLLSKLATMLRGLNHQEDDLWGRLK